jgi:hypothetical protein
MNLVSKIAAQGDVLFRRIESLPADVVEQPRKGRLVVAHSETGHHHAIDDPAVKIFERATRDPMICYLQIAGEHADVVHHRPHDTHGTLRLIGGGSTWEVRRQREYTPQGWRRVED